MKTRNKVIIGSVILFLGLVFTGYGLVSAYGPRGDSWVGFHPRFHPRGFHSPAFHRDIADFILWKMDKKAKELKLNAEQNAKYEALKENIKGHLVEFQNDHQGIRDQFLKEMSKEAPDIQSLIKSAKAKLNDFSGFMDKNMDLLLDFYNSLDNHQKRLVNDEIRERMKYHQS